MKRLLKEDACELPAVQAAVRAWQREKFDCASERQQLRMYRELLRDVLPPFLVGHVKKAKRAMIWDAVVTIRTVLLTWGDTMSDYYALVLLLQADSSYAMITTVRPSTPDDDSAQPTTRNDPPPPPAAIGRRGAGARVASETRRRSSLLEQLRGASAQLFGDDLQIEILSTLASSPQVALGRGEAILVHRTLEGAHPA